MWSTAFFTKNVARFKLTVPLFERVGIRDHGEESSALKTRGPPGIIHLYSISTNGDLIHSAFLCKKEKRMYAPTSSVPHATVCDVTEKEGLCVYKDLGQGFSSDTTRSAVKQSLHLGFVALRASR